MSINLNQTAADAYAAYCDSQDDKGGSITFDDAIERATGMPLMALHPFEYDAVMVLLEKLHSYECCPWTSACFDQGRVHAPGLLRRVAA